ncbi:GIY-YIG nuclease family protein [Candidatus Beckwithbacteria bacterium]|nr:GIY-YIG nuclease family protein [Candidatus Beckwithbacteria bacterium]
MFYVYFVISSIDNSVYVGFTHDLITRIKQHNQGKTKSLKSKIPIKLIYYEAYLTKTLARKREIYIKKNQKAKEEVLKRLISK